MAVQRDEYKIVSAGYDKTIRVWDLRRGEPTSTLSGHSASVLCMQFDKEKIVTGSADKTLKIWDFAKTLSE